MDTLQNASRLSGYWAMTAQERERHDALLLSEERLQWLSAHERWVAFLDQNGYSYEERKF